MFRKIGQFEILVEGEIVNIWSSPEFNVEAAQEYAVAMEKIIDGMPPVFGVMTRFEAPPIVGPDVEAAFGETARHRAQRGMVAVAFIIAQMDQAGLAIAKAQWDRIYGPIGVSFSFFSDVESADPWLRKQIQQARERYERRSAGN
jgi:hypothetical protein